MPESACLHIQARDADPIRVVEIPGASVRIGRASYCEVRLPEPEVADEECLLRRRGRIWHLVPVGRTGLVMIDDHPVEWPRPIPFGMPFRVGDHQLTLQATSEMPGRWGSFHRPISLEVPTIETTPRDEWRVEPPRAEREPADEPPRESPQPEPGPAGFEDEQERLARWQARQEQRESWLKARQEERRWEERWKAAGERFRARSATPPPRPTPSPVFQGHESTDRAISSPREGVRVRKVARRFVPVPPPSTGESAFPISPGSVTPLRPRREPITSSDWGAIPIPTRAESPSARAIPLREHTLRNEPASVEVEGVQPPAEVLISPAPAAPEPKVEPERFSHGQCDQSVRVAQQPRSESASAGVAVQPQPPSGAEAPEAPTAIASDATVEPDPIPERFETSTGTSLFGWDNPLPFRIDTSRAAPEPQTVSDSVVDAPASVEEVGAGAPRPRLGVGRSKRISPRTAAPGSRRGESPKTARAAAPVSQPVPIAGPSRSESNQAPAASRDWPTAREIFAAQRARQVAQAASKLAASRTRPQLVQTVAQDPACWSVPLWLGWPLALAVSVGVGGFVLVLALVWSRDDRAAGLVSNHLARGNAKGKPLPETVVPPLHPSWWNTTSSNLARWALERDRAAREPGQAEEVRALLEAATRVSPVDAGARFALARPDQHVEGAVPLHQGLGLSRDVVSLSWSGRQLLAAGKKGAALKAYRAALEMASRAELSRLAPPAFLDDSQARRYALPSEDLIGGVVRDLAERTDWRFADWSEALPRFGVALLVAARVLRERSSLESDTALDAVLATANAPPPVGVPVAVHLAAQGEALALKSHWSEAEERYRQAIDLMPDDRVRRSWYFNLADLALRLDDEPKRLKALEAAQGADSQDEITQRALDLLRFTRVRSLTSGSQTADTTKRNGSK
jgi:tetratricopeptide (TPR) repeat protein/pSer/pThr/pTyr-binding forkhead associated (FHA) protein